MFYNHFRRSVDSIRNGYMVNAVGEFADVKLRGVSACNGGIRIDDTWSACNVGNRHLHRCIKMTVKCDVEFAAVWVGE